MVSFRVVAVFLVIVNSVFVSSENPLARGFGDDVKWVKFEDSVKTATELSKPIFLLIHKTWCGACQKLKPFLSESHKFQEFSESFVMVNAEDDDEPNGEAYTPDGGYVPRILFLDSAGNVEASIYNKYGNPKYKYYYQNAEQVILSMQSAVEWFNSKTNNNLSSQENVVIKKEEEQINVETTTRAMRDEM